MTRKQATNLMSDIRKNIEECDFDQNLYVSIAGIGTKIFKNCAYHEVDDWTFIWTRDEDFMLNRGELGDFVIVPQSHNVVLSLEPRNLC